MLPLALKLLAVLTCVTAVYLTTEAADTCSVTRASCIPGLPGRDGKDGQPGRDGQLGRDGVDGRDGEPGAVGPQGIPGMNGTDGEQGPVGPVGPQGPVGPAGPQGPVGPQGPDGVVSDVVIEQLRTDILEQLRREICPGDRDVYPAASCKEIHGCNPTAPSGYYWISTTTGPLQVYCQMDANNCGNITGGWMRAAYIDMTDENNTCPQGLNYTVINSTRICTSSHSTSGCTSVIFPTHGVSYTKVCGRALAYQRGSTDGFNNYHHGQSTLNDYYVDGLSMSYGNPRIHIWTFAAGLSKARNFPTSCPCSIDPGVAAPPFLSENYFCESGISGGLTVGAWYLDDPLWDSQGCPSGSTCCDRSGPWFTTTLSQEVIDNIEVRWCFDEDSSNEDIGVEQLEIFVY